MIECHIIKCTSDGVGGYLADETDLSERDVKFLLPDTFPDCAHMIVRYASLRSAQHIVNCLTKLAADKNESRRNKGEYEKEFEFIIEERKLDVVGFNHCKE